MFARLVRYQVDPERCKEALEAFRSAANDIGEIDGIRGGYVLVDGETGHLFTLTLWEDRTKLEASEVRASRLRQEAIRGVEGDCEFVERLEVAQEIAES